MMQRPPFTQRNADHFAFRLFRRFADRFGNFARLAGSKSDAAALVTDDDQSGESHAATAFYGLRNAVDIHELINDFVHFAVAIVALISAFTIVFAFFFAAAAAFCIRCACHNYLFL